LNRLFIPLTSEYFQRIIHFRKSFDQISVQIHEAQPIWVKNLWSYQLFLQGYHKAAERVTTIKAKDALGRRLTIALMRSKKK
jgi:hypothetical protein